MWKETYKYVSNVIYDPARTRTSISQGYRKTRKRDSCVQREIWTCTQVKRPLSKGVVRALVTLLVYRSKCQKSLSTQRSLYSCTHFLKRCGMRLLSLENALQHVILQNVFCSMDIWKETYVCDERRMYVERGNCMWKEACVLEKRRVCVERDVWMWKRDVGMWKETYVCKKRRMYAKRDLWIYITTGRPHRYHLERYAHDVAQYTL